jgi:hypothetical protein
MGKQVKKKQIRDQDTLKNSTEASNDFIHEIEQQGYQLQNIQRSPDLPSNKAEPQL